MSASLLLAHKRYMFNLLDADNISPALVVQDGAVTDGVTPPYVVCYFSMRTPRGEDIPQDVSLDRQSDVIITTGYFHSIGGDQDASISVAGRVRRALLAVEPVIAGRVCYPIKHDDNVPTDRDESDAGTAYDTVDVYSFKSLPA